MGSLPCRERGSLCVLASRIARGAPFEMISRCAPHTPQVAEGATITRESWDLRGDCSATPQWARLSSRTSFRIESSNHRGWLWAVLDPSGAQTGDESRVPMSYSCRGLRSGGILPRPARPRPATGLRPRPSGCLTRSASNAAAGPSLRAHATSQPHSEDTSCEIFPTTRWYDPDAMLLSTTDDEDPAPAGAPSPGDRGGSPSGRRRKKRRRRWSAGATVPDIIPERDAEKQEYWITAVAR